MMAESCAPSLPAAMATTTMPTVAAGVVPTAVAGDHQFAMDMSAASVPWQQLNHLAQHQPPPPTFALHHSQPAPVTATTTTTAQQQEQQNHHHHHQQQQMMFANHQAAAAAQQMYAAFMQAELAGASGTTTAAVNVGDGNNNNNVDAATNIMKHSYAAFLQQTAVDANRLGQPRPTYVNAKQYHRIMKRRETRAALEEHYKKCAAVKQKRENKRQQNLPYQHESRHRHAMKRPRGKHGRFLTGEELAVYYRENPDKDPNNIMATRTQQEQQASLLLQQQQQQQQQEDALTTAVEALSEEMEEPASKRVKETTAYSTTTSTDASSTD